MTAVFAALISAAGFLGASLLALFGKEMTTKWRSYLVAIAAGILLALSFGDLFPEALELAGEGAVLAFVGGFALLFIAEAFTRARTHTSPRERTDGHALGLFESGLAMHNLVDGFVLGVSANLSGLAAGAITVGVLAHQIPVGISLAAVLAASGAGRDRIMRKAALLGLAIPLAAAVTVAFPDPGDRSLGLLIGVAGGAMAYLGAAHLLPEAQANARGGTTLPTSLVFVAALTATTLGLSTAFGN